MIVECCMIIHTPQSPKGFKQEPRQVAGFFVYRRNHLLPRSFSPIPYCLSPSHLILNITKATKFILLKLPTTYNFFLYSNRRNFKWGEQTKFPVV